MEYNKKKKQFLGGFGSESMVEEFYLSKHTKLRPGTVISENEDSYKIELGVPFLREEDMEVELMQNDRLVVRGKGDVKDAPDKERKYKGIFHITRDVRRDEIEATVKDGLLTIRFPKKKIQGKQRSAVTKNTSK